MSMTTRTWCSLMLLAGLADVAPAQVTWDVFANPLPTQQTLAMTLANGSPGTITLPSSAPWSIWDDKGGRVFIPIGLPVVMPLAPNQSAVYRWDQKDGWSQYVKPGLYEARIAFFDRQNQKVLLKAPFQILRDKLTLSTSTPMPGTTVELQLSSPGAPTLPYVAAVSLSTRPGIPLGGKRELELTLDGLLYLSLTAGKPLFENFQGRLDQGGQGVARLHLPAESALKGVQVHGAHVTLASGAPGGILGYSAPQRLTIQ